MPIQEAAILDGGTRLFLKFIPQPATMLPRLKCLRLCRNGAAYHADQLFEFASTGISCYQFQMTQRVPNKRRKTSHRLVGTSEPGNLLDMLLALDRTVVETSMRKYRIAGSEKSAIRAHQRRMHEVIREFRRRSSRLFRTHVTDVAA